MFVKELASLDVPQPLSRYAPQTYDAVWAIALALRGAEERWQNNSVAKLDSFDYTRYDMALEFLHQFSRLNFLGVSVSSHTSCEDTLANIFSECRQCWSRQKTIHSFNMLLNILFFFIFQWLTRTDQKNLTRTKCPRDSRKK